MLAVTDACVCLCAFTGDGGHFAGQGPWRRRGEHPHARSQAISHPNQSAGQTRARWTHAPRAEMPAHYVCHLTCFHHVHAGPAILEDVLIEVFRTLYTQCQTELDLQNQSPFSKDQTHLSRSGQCTRCPQSCESLTWSSAWISDHNVILETLQITFTKSFQSCLSKRW